METYLPYNPNATQKKSESAQITNALITLRHIPKQGSIVINNFTESSSAQPAQGSFFCNYSADTFYRDANRTIIFNAADNNRVVDIEYIAVGTPFTADDANEIKEHLENNSIHGAASSLVLTNEVQTVQGGFWVVDKAEQPLLALRWGNNVYLYKPAQFVHQTYFALDPDCIIFFPFDDNLTDAAGNYWTEHGSVPVTGYQAAFDGNSYLSINNSLSVNNSFTFDIYLTIDPNAPADCSIFAFHNSNGTTNDLQLFRAGSDNKLFFYYRGRQSDAFSVPFGEPFHLTIIAVFGQAYTYIYVNGTKIIQMPGSFYGNTFSSIWLGKCKDDAKPLFKGSINQFRLYNRSAWELIN